MATRRYGKKSHEWTDAERQIILDNPTLNSAQLKRKFFRSDRTVNEKAIYMQRWNMSHGITKLNSAPAKTTGTSTTSNVSFAIESAFDSFKAHSKSVKEVAVQLKQIITRSTISKEKKADMVADIENHVHAELTNKSKELAKAIA